MAQELKLTKTKAALAKYDEADRALRAAPGSTSTEDFEVLFAAEEAADLAVREAFAEETADRNTRQNAMLVAPKDPWLRRLVAEYG